MKVLFLAPHPFYAPRGTPIADLALLEALSELGHRADVLSYHKGTDVTDVPRVRHYRARKPPLVKHVPIGPSWQKVLCDLNLYAEAKRLIREAGEMGEPYDVVHAVEETAFMAERLERRFGVPYVVDMDSLMSEQLTEKSRLLWLAAVGFRRLERRTIRRSAGVLAVCQSLADVALKYHPTGNVALLPDIPHTGVATGSLPDALLTAQGPPHGVRFMYVGNLEAYQGIDLLLDAFSRLKLDDINATLLIVGGREDHINAYSGEYRTLVTTGRLRFVGPLPIERLGLILRHADVLVSPRTQGLNTPMKLYSYLQSGKAVLATRLPTHTQVVDDTTAMLVAPEAAAMSKAMRQLAESAPRRERLGTAGRQLVEEHYSRAAFVERVRVFYEGLGLGGVAAVEEAVALRHHAA